ncbi:hypothetical protein AB0M02_44415 [Actinoplanes sp. NPDC051861]|uniref:hypothetical protein n=1 Tax=Actinoplanes sp. NPDC051861 TaxID=3155170 RepID=UPI0034309944
MNAVRAELTKLLTLPSLWITAALTWTVTLLLRAVDAPGSVPAHTMPGLLVLGVLATAHEYQPGNQIRATLLAVPRRLPLAAAKFTALTVTAVPLATLVALTGDDLATTPPLVLLILVAAALGVLLRNPLTAVTTALTAYVILGPLLRFRFPGTAAWLPDTAVHEPGRGLLAASLWAATALLLAALALHRRDA